MAKRQKKDLTSKLGSEMGKWEDQAHQTKPESEPDENLNKSIRKTFMITNRILNRINETASANDVGQGELVRFLLTWSLDQIDAGELTIPKGKPTYSIDY